MWWSSPNHLRASQLPGREGHYLPAPVEYKRGKPKQEQSDEAQLCAQAICLEEMLAVSIPTGYLYYGETRHREDVAFTAALRDLVQSSPGNARVLPARLHPAREALEGLPLLFAG